jgi:hypothetical protein
MTTTAIHIVTVDITEATSTDGVASITARSGTCIGPDHTTARITQHEATQVVDLCQPPGVMTRRLFVVFFNKYNIKETRQTSSSCEL